MTDLSKTIAPKSDQLNADDLIAGPRTITVTRVVGQEDDVQQPVSIFFEGDNGKPYKPGLSMRRVLVIVWGPDGDNYIGRSMTLFNDPEVVFGGIKVGGIRISHMSHIDSQRSVMLTRTRGKKNEFVVSPLSTDPGGQILLDAQAAADKGLAALQVWWTGDGKAHQKRLKDELPKLKERAAAADEAAKPLSQRLAGATTPETETPPVRASEGLDGASDEDAYDAALKEERE